MQPEARPSSTGPATVSEVAAPPPPIPLRGLLVDWGGVLTPPLDDTMAAWARRDNVDFGHFRAVLAEWVGSGPPGAPGTVAGGDGPDGPDSPDGTDSEDDGGDGPGDRPQSSGSPIHRLERGELESATFERELAAALAQRGSPVGHDGLLGRMLEGLVTLDSSMIGLVRRAHAAGVRTALLSNSWGDHYPDELWDGLFDAVVISGRVGMRKPEPRIFRHTAEAIGLEPASCVMVDDLPRNIRAAVATGMTGVLHRSYEETRGELAALFALPDAPALP